MKLLLTIAVLGLVAAHLASAISPDGRTDRFMARGWTTEDGLPQSSVNDIVQTSDGYLWIATYGGLARFDGVKFESFGVAKHPGLPSNRILTLVDAEDGALWVGTEMSGIVFLKDGVFHAFEPPDGLGLQGVARVYIGPSGTIWIGTAFDLLRLKPNGDFTRFTTEDGLAPPPVYSVLEEADGTVWVGSQEGLTILREDRFESVTVAGTNISWIQAIRRSHTGTLWIGALEGLFHHVPGRGLEPAPIPNHSDLQAVNSLLEDRTGALWIGLHPKGLYRLVDGEAHDIGSEIGLATEAITASFEDAEGTIWVGSSSAGLYQLNPARFTSTGGPDSSLDFSVVPIVDDGADGLWIGTNCKGLAHLEHGEVTLLREDDGLAVTCIWSLLRSRTGDLYIGSFSDGVHRLRGNKFEALGGPSTTGGATRSLFETSEGHILAGTDEGLFRLDPVTSTFSLIGGTENLIVYFITEDEDGNLWLGTHSGLHIVSEGTHEVWDTSNGLASNIVRAVYIDQEGAAWIGTYGGGLYRLDGDHLSHFGKHNGLHENVVSLIIEDEHGRLWMTGNSGVTRVSKSELQRVADGLADEVVSTLFGKADGMLENECNGGGQPAGHLTEDGFLWVPTISGVAAVDTRSETVNPLQPPVHIKEVLVNGRRLDLSRPVTLPPGSRNLEISYTALSFVDPSKVRFKYRLTGVDEDWQEAGTRRTAYFPFLPPGRHQFQVIARNNDGIWNEIGATFGFSVKPRFVQTPWFFALVVLVVAGIVAGIMRLRHLSLKQRERMLTLLVATRTAELEKLAGLAERINSAVLPEDVLQHVFDSFRPTIPYDRIGFAAITEDGQSVRAVWACSDAGHMEIQKGFEASLQGSSLEQVLETGEPRILNDLQAYLAAHPKSDSTRRIVDEGMRSSLTCPLYAMGNPLGFLFFSSRQTSTFTDVHVRFFQQIAGQLSHAIEKSRLYSDLLLTREYLEQANRELEALATVDGLTGLTNRRVLDKILDEEWRRCIRSQTPLSLMMIDIDHFKLYNDTYGHQKGDDCLKRFAEELELSFQRSGECVARYGGEEFAVVLPDTTAQEASRVAIRFLRKLEALRIPHEGSPVGPWVTASIGIATEQPSTGVPQTALVLHADRALYRAKNAGRNRCYHAGGVQDA